MAAVADLDWNPEPESQRLLFFGISALLFAASAATTILWGLAMSAMGEVPMPGGWAMSMAWLPMCGQTWFSAAASFTGMWVVMMVAMMLPSLTPMLWRYREAMAGADGSRPGLLAAMVALGYFATWTALGIAIFPLGAALMEAAQRWPALAHAVPFASVTVILIAGALQFTAWKRRHLAYCRQVPGRGSMLPAETGAALRHGLRLGLHCCYSCAGATAVLLVMGVMDLRAMAVMAAAITAERLAPAGGRTARIIGIIAIGMSPLPIAQATGLG